MRHFLFCSLVTQFPATHHETMDPFDMRDVVQNALDDYEDSGSDDGSDEDGDIREFDEDEDDEEREERRIREVNTIANHPAPESFTNLDLSSSNPSLQSFSFSPLPFFSSLLDSTLEKKKKKKKKRCCFLWVAALRKM